MVLKILLSLIFVLFVILLLGFYWFIPFGTTDFGTASKNYNFSLINSNTGMQFYKNMRFPNKEISYNIYDCPLQKQNNMDRAFEIISNLTVLNFYPVDFAEEVSVTCDSKNKFKDGLFIAGEGGPTNITKGELFNVIFNGKILLIKESKCERPNVALHELLHVLGFNHSENQNNIMYLFSECKQTIGEDIPNLIDELYSVESYPDLAFENVSAIMHGRYMDSNISISNNGLADSEKTEVLIYADEKLVERIDLDVLGIGYKRIIRLSNIWIKKPSFQKLEFFINSSFSELEKKNNRISLEIKNKN